MNLCLGSEAPRLKSLPSDLICRQIPSDAVPKVCLKSTAKKIPKSIGASLFDAAVDVKGPGGAAVELHCPFHVCVAGFDHALQFWWRIWKRPSLLTRSNAFVRSLKAIYRGICCSLHFSWSSRREKTMSIVGLPARKPHCDSG